jgi:S1-C subfamily serine protease
MSRSALLVSVLSIVLAAPAGAGNEPPAAEARASRRTPVVEVFESARDAVVSISSTEKVIVRSRSPFDSFFDEFFEMPPSRERSRDIVGSGFVIHSQGYIVTNAHVVARSSEQRVMFAGGAEYEATIVAADKSRDLAILKIDAGTSLPTLPFGRSDDLMIGETVVAIGNPFGFQHTVTAGVVSAVNRDVTISREIVFEDLIQTDASINPGNSGGPLLNALGQLIGVNTAIRGDAENIGFAIPVTTTSRR